MRVLVHRFLPLALIAAAVVSFPPGGVAACARAQEAGEPAMDELADEMPADADELAVDEEPEPEKPKPKVVKKETDEAEPTVPNDPAVQAVLESHPKTPAELLRAIDILVDLGHAPLAKPFADELTKLKLDPTAKAALVAQANSAKLLKLARQRELAAVLGPFVDDLLRAAEAYRRDPKRLAAWAQQLSDIDESTRAQAALALVQAREAAVAPLVAILADPKRDAEHRVARAILVQLDDLAIAPLLGVLESPDAALKSQVIDILGRIRAAQAVAPLLGPLVSPASTPELRAAATRALESIAGHVPSPPEALRLLEHAARRPLEQSKREDDESTAPVEVWHWNAKRRQSMPIQYDATGAALAKSVRLARELYLLDPNQATRRRLYLTALLQAAKIRGGLDKPLASSAGTAYALAAQQGSDVIEDLLTDAMATGYLPAATAAAEILGDIGSAAMLSRGASPSPLAKAAAHADRRLRFAAVNAIMKLHPTQPFAGSNHVADGLGFFASSFGVPRVLVVHPLSVEAQKIAGLAAGLGYESDSATNGRKAFELAVGSPDYEFVLIHSAVERPRADELLAQLRRDRRTASLPVGLIAPLDELERVKRYADETPRTLAFLQPQNEPEMKLFSGEVLKRAGRAHVSASERKAQAIAALDWLVALGERPQRLFDLRRQEPAMMQVLFVPGLNTRAATVLADLGTAKAQRALVDLANLTSQPLATRQAAAAAFAHSVHRHGILLTKDEILEQYDFYNSNAGQDAETHTVLGVILDALEEKTSARQANPSSASNSEPE